MPNRIPIDKELLVRVERLRSAVEQAKQEIAKIEDCDRKTAGEKATSEMSDWLECALKPETEYRLRYVTQLEAELCLWQPRVLLEADEVRLRDRFYRFSDAAKKAWGEQIDRLRTGGAASEPDYRQLLRRLTYEVAEAAEAYERLARERSDALWWIMLVSVALLIVLLVGFVWALVTMLDDLRKGTDQAAFVRTFPMPLVMTLLFSGSIGALVTIIPTVISQEKPRQEYAWTVLVNVLIRSLFGAVYAIVVVFAVVCGILPLRPSDDKSMVMFVVVAAVAAGVSDRLFGQIITNVITNKPAKKPAKDAK